MENWKRGLLAGSAGLSMIFLLKGSKTGAMLFGGVALAALASEYPDQFEKVRRSLPHYFDRGMQVMEMAAKAGKRITEAAGRSAADRWEEIGG